MSKTKAKAPQRLSREDKLKILKRAKLYEGSTKIVKGKASGAQKRVLALFRQDIPLLASGNARAVSLSKIPKKDRPKGMKGRGSRVIIKSEPGEILRVTKDGEITSVIRAHGKKYRRRIIPVEKKGDLSKLPEGKNIRYQIQFKQWGYKSSPIFQSKADLIAFMFPYEVENGGTYEDWEDYVEVLELL